MPRRNAIKLGDATPDTKHKAPNARRVISNVDPLNPILSEPYYDASVDFNEQEAKKKNINRLNRRLKLTEEEKKEDNRVYRIDHLPYYGDGMSNKYKSVKIHKLSPAQQRKLKKGNKVIIKGGGDHEIMLSPEQEKKFNKKSMMGCGITIQLDPYQQDMVMNGSGFKDFVGQMKKAKIGKKIIKFAKDNKILKRVGNALIDRAVATIAGSGVCETVKRKRGRPRKGGALMPAGGGGGALKPAGNY